MDSPPVENAVSRALERVLYPLVKLLLRFGFPFAAFADVARKVYVDVAVEQFQLPGRKQSDSRIAVLTGLTRKEVKRLRAAHARLDQDLIARHNRIHRVINGWANDPHFVAADGQPKELPLEGGTPSFQELARRYSGDIPARAVLDELKRINVVSVTGNETVRLQRAQIHAMDAQRAELLSRLGDHAGELIRAIEQGFERDEGTPAPTRMVIVDTTERAEIEDLRAFAQGRSQALLDELEAWRGGRAREGGERPAGTYRVGLGIFLVDRPLDERQSDR